MKKTLLLLLFALTFAVFAAPPRTAVQAQQTCFTQRSIIFANPSFEFGQNGWTFSPQPFFTGTASVSTTASRSGFASGLLKPSITVTQPRTGAADSQSAPSLIKQQIFVPADATCGTLTFWLQYRPDPNVSAPGNDLFSAGLGQDLGFFGGSARFIGSSGLQPYVWTPITINLSPSFYRGQSVDVRFEAQAFVNITFDVSGNANFTGTKRPEFFIDDVEVRFN